MKAALGSNQEEQRLEALYQYELLDTPPEPAFDDLTRLAATICGAPISVISLIDADRQWFKSKVGLTVAETPRAVSFCAHAIREADLMVVQDATRDMRFAQNPHVTGDPNVRFYAGAPLLTTDGFALGTLCVIDRVPRELNAAQQETLRVLSRQVMAQLELRRQQRSLLASEARTQLLINASGIGLWDLNLQTNEVFHSPEWKRQLGYTDEEMPSRHGEWESRLHPDDRAATLKSVEDYLAGRRKEYDIEYRLRHRDGSYRWILTRAALLRDAAGKPVRMMGSHIDITERKAHEAEIERLQRLYLAFSHVNQAIVRLPNRDELFRKVCQVLVEHGGFCMAWIGWHNPETHQIVPVADWGDATGYIYTLRLFADERPEGCGPSGVAFRTNRHYVCNDVGQDPIMEAWRDELLRRGYRALAVFPIRQLGQPCGTLCVFSEEAQFFQDKEIGLLEESAGDISFALDNLARDEERRRAEAIARLERHFSDVMIESMPGVLYFYDTAGRFLRWNRNFETVTGFTHEEIARMHPLDFFAPQDRLAIQARIAEVFTKGESNVEAPFVAKDGTATPYFFTGRRVEFDGQICLVGVGIDISARQQAEQALATSEQKYRELVEYANSIILRWNSEGRVTFLNEFGQRFFGYTAEEILGRHVIGTIVPPTESDGRDLQQLMEEICANPKAFEQNVNENVRRNGERVAVAWTNRIVRDAEGQVREILSIGTDITEQRRINEALRRNEEQFRLIMENLADLVAVLDLNGHRLYSSPSYGGILGDPDKLRGSSSFDQIHPDDRARVRRIFEETVRTGIGQRLEYRLVARGGDTRHIESQGSVIRDAHGKVAQVIVVSRDITERREAEAAIRELNTTLERRVVERTAELAVARDRAEAADRLKSAFLATMSHELRTPLNSIIGFTGIVLQGLAGPLNPEQTKQLGMVRGSARHLLELINDVLDLSKIEAGQLEVRAEPFDLAASIERVVASVKPLAEKKGLALEVSVPPALGELVGDRRRVEQVLINLLNNALKFTDKGKVTLTVETIADYRPAADSPPAPGVRLRTTDTGMGIKPHDLTKLFQPFRQIDTGLARQHEGTGLGLAICRRLATLMGGEIVAASEWGKGSEFTVLLPRKRVIT